MITKRRFLFEADDDNASATTSNTNDSTESNDTTATDNNAESNESEDNSTEKNNDAEQNNQDENKDDNKEEENNNEDEEKDPDEFSDDDFTIGDADNADDSKDKEESSSDSSFNSEDEHKLDPDSLKAKDRELFDTLSIEEQQIKVKELKKQFGDLYSECVSLIDRFNEISIEISSKQVNNISSLLLELKSMISFYVLNIYDIKSFVENDVMFNRYLSILNNIQNTLKDIKNDEFSDK